jgi:DNA polymerase-4
MKLLREDYRFQKPLRSIGIRAVNLEPEDSSVQFSFYADENRQQKWETIEKTMDVIRQRFDHHAISIALMAFDKRLGKLDAKSENIIHPIGYF